MDKAKYGEKQIKVLMQLQSLDSDLCRLEEARGTLPQAIAGFEEKVREVQEKRGQVELRLREYNRALANQKDQSRNAKALVKEYEAKRKVAKNDVEYKIISKDLDLEKLSVILAQKKIKEYYAKVDEEEVRLAEIGEEEGRYVGLLGEKKAELKRIDEENRAKIEELEGKRLKAIRSLDATLYNMYSERYGHLRNVVVDIVNDACGGCFIVVPLQVQIDVQLRKKVLTCELCSRIFASVQAPEQPKPKARVSRRKQMESVVAE